ncbi:MAG: DUF2284 domain-containing protein [Desulfobacter sp.]|nr:DUF2284 domain-containing protein [Desulfobacter sp.]WDP85614.1 MAG: DUF2284 domain-containing protein [Desulfobacter sp.]
MTKNKDIQKNLSFLIHQAKAQGVSDALIIPSNKILVKKELARYCSQPKCSNFGQSLSCPPHVQGPDQFNQWLKDYTHALFFNIEVPSSILFSYNASQIFAVLHDTAAYLEITAKAMGYDQARAFAGGSCKSIFCHDKPDCQGLSPQGLCRHPDQARPSMSGFGIDVAHLIKIAGWEQQEFIEGKTLAPQKETAGVYGLVLIC